MWFMCRSCVFSAKIVLVTFSGFKVYWKSLTVRKKVSCYHEWELTDTWRPPRSVKAEIGEGFFSWAALHTDSAGEGKKDHADTHEAVCGSDDTPKDCIGLQRACHNFCYVAGHAFYFADLNKYLKWCKWQLQLSCLQTSLWFSLWYFI